MPKFEQLAEIIERELSEADARRLVDALRLELGGMRFLIPQPSGRTIITDRQIDAALREARYSIEGAAKILGVHHATLYRRLDARRQRNRKGPAVEPGPTFKGLPVR